MTDVSVIIPAFRAEPFIARSVGSVLAQNHSLFEIIVVSDDAQDYRSILTAQGINDPRLRFASTGKTGAGPGAARNAGLTAAQYHIIANLDADDAWSDNYLAAMAPIAFQYGACTSTVRVIDAASGIIAGSSPYTPTNDRALSMRDCIRYCPTYAPIVFNRRDCNVRWPELHYGEDTLFWLLLLDILPSIRFVTNARYDYYMIAGSLSRPDEEDTHEQCNRRNRMIEWLDQHAPPGCNLENRDFMKRWASACNGLEEYFGYRLAELNVYLDELNRRMDALFGDDREKHV